MLLTMWTYEKKSFWALCDVVIPRFGHSVKLTSQPGSLPRGLALITILAANTLHFKMNHRPVIASGKVTLHFKTNFKTKSDPSHCLCLLPHVGFVAKICRYPPWCALHYQSQKRATFVYELFSLQKYTQMSFNHMCTHTQARAHFK